MFSESVFGETDISRGLLWEPQLTTFEKDQLLKDVSFLKSIIPLFDRVQSPLNVIKDKNIIRKIEKTLLKINSN